MYIKNISLGIRIFNIHIKWTFYFHSWNSLYKIIIIWKESTIRGFHENACEKYLTISCASWLFGKGQFEAGYLGDML